MIDKNLILKIRNDLPTYMSARRVEHTLSVEKEAVRLCEIFLPDKAEKMHVAALLHDLTKEYSVEEQIQLLNENNIETGCLESMTPAILHAQTAAIIAPKYYSEANDADIISAIKNHTTGSAQMSIFDCLLYLADYMEPTRKHESCVFLRAYFWGGIDEKASLDEKTAHLYNSIIKSFDLTIKNLISNGDMIAPRTIDARNAFVVKLKEKNSRKENSDR